MKKYVIKNQYTVTAGKWMEAAWFNGGNAEATKCHHRNICDVTLYVPENVKFERLEDYVENCR